MHIGLFGGSFDPVHHGHLILARAAAEQLGLDKVLFVPAAKSPFKQGERPAPAELRLRMVEEAIRGEPGFGVDDIDIRRPPPSYTVDTVEALRSRTPAEWTLLVGQDNVEDLQQWHRYEDLVRLVRIAVLARRSFSGALKDPALPVVRKSIEISSTEIRNRVAAGQSVRYLLPESVASIITTHQLYRNPDHSS